MRFISIFTHEPSNRPPTEAEMARMGKLVGDAMREGWLISTEGVSFAFTGVRVHRSSSGKITVTDGPFTESKEVLGGYALLKGESEEEIVGHTKRFSRSPARALARSIVSTRSRARGGGGTAMAGMLAAGLIGLAAITSALVAGFFLAFSVVVMQALQALPAADGIAAMQRVNVGATGDQGAEVWTRYLSVWTAWNHVRTAAPLLAAVAFVLALLTRSG